MQSQSILFDLFAKQASDSLWPMHGWSDSVSV